MGIASQLGWTGLNDWIDPRRNTLMGLGAGLLSGNLGNAGLYAMQGRQADDAYATTKKADAERQRAINQTATKLRATFPDLADAVESGALDPNAAYNEMFKRNMPADTKAGVDPSDVATYKFYANQELQASRAPKSFDDWFRGSKQAAKSGLGPPVYGKNKKTGEYMPFEPMSDGSFTSLTDKNANIADYTFDPGMVASDKAAGAGYGALQGPDQYNLPKQQQDIETELGNIDALLQNTTGMDQSFGNVAGFGIGGVGFPNQWTPSIPNTPRAGFDAQLKQVAGENFLSAYATLRGSGAITEVEGQQAKEAMARLSTAQSKDDFTRALGDLKTILVRGYQTMQTKTTAGPYQSSGFTPPQLNTGGQTSGGFQVLSVTP